jgi:hypothetical protein
MRTALLAVLLLAACGGDPLDITIPKLPEGPAHRHLRMPDSLPLRRYQYRLEVQSNAMKQVRIEARLEDPAPEGVIARIADGTEQIPREGTAWPTLVVIVPEKEGAFRGALRITSPELPEWAVRYTFEGNVVPGTLPGRNLVAKPAGADMGTMRPGEEKPFEIVLSCFGSEAVKIQGWGAEDPQRVRLSSPPAEGVVVEPGGEFKLKGSVVAPRAAGPFKLRARIHSDAENHQKGLMLRFGGVVVPDYAPYPPRAVETAAYPVQETEFKVVIRARDEVPAFTVKEAAGHERYFDVVSLGTAEPAREQIVKFKLRRDAPTDAERDAEWQVRLRIEPGGIDVTWPVKIRLNRPIHASPQRIDFRTVPQGTERKQEILLTGFLNRPFKVTGARAERVGVTLPDHAPGTAWRVVVRLPASLAAGVIDDRVIIETDDPDVPHLIVPVRAEIR